MQKLIIFLLVLASLNAHAVLGKKADSIQKAAKILKAKAVAASSTSELWTAQDIESNGTTLREYLNSDGTVFAVAWTGVLEPDLATILGDYYTDYSDALKLTPKSVATRRNLSIQTTQIRVQKFGHMRAWHGLAYVPSLVPDGVSVEDLSL